jgi:hypothetical protein
MGALYPEAWPYRKHARTAKITNYDSRKLRHSAQSYDGYEVWDILPTISADPELSSQLPGGPQYVTYQWHREGFRFDPDLDES